MESFDTILQNSLTPVTLVSGVGLLLLTLTNRYGKLLDRIRAILADRKNKKEVEEQVNYLFTSARIQRNAIFCAVFCVLSAVLLILTQFIGLILDIPTTTLGAGLFLLSLSFLSLSLLLFIYDLSKSLRAISVVLKTRSIR